MKRYLASLGELKPRISGQAWNFFANGYGLWGLHDGQLISLSIGDGLDYRPDGTYPFRINHQRTIALITFLNYEQDLLYTFELRGVCRMHSDLITEVPNRSLGDLYTYELVTLENDLLQLGFLFATGSTIVVQFNKLIFRRRRLKRKYPSMEKYK